jgi:protoporphyrinogen oxidase
MQDNFEASNSKKVVIIGAGPAGLTAAYELCKAGIESVVLEKDNIVGGLARTVNYNGYHFDIGGHRFFTKVKVVEDMWHEVLGEGFLRRSRLSRIYYNKKFFYYPLRLSNVLSNLGLWNSFLIVLSYVKAQLLPEKTEETFEKWICKRFGKRLYLIFFKTYTEKVWGIPCSAISAEWAAQRIKGLSLLTAIRNALLKQQNFHHGNIIKTLIDAFNYPKLGPGMMWETVLGVVQRRGSKVNLGAGVEKICWTNDKVYGLEIKVNERSELIKGTHFISSMPIRELIQKFEPAVPEEVLKAAMGLGYRDFLTVALVINKRDVFPDNWIYIHDPEVRVGRIQNFKNWSPYMVPDMEKTCLGLEYFCFEGDELWTMSDQELIELGKKELEALGLVYASDVEDGTVARMPKAYPVYDSKYREALQIIRQFLDGIHNLQLVGRNGMHKYNNQDHSMLTSMLAVKNILGANYDLWSVNADQEYHEEVTDLGEKGRGEFSILNSTQPRVPEQSPMQPRQSISNEVLIKVFARMDKLAFATALGSVCGLAIFIATFCLIIKGGGVIGPNLQLLGQYFIGYRVTIGGAFIGMGYGLLWGFVWGWLFAYLRNFLFGFLLYAARKKAESLLFKDFLDYI